MLGNDEDLVQFYLTHPDRALTDHDEVTFLIPVTVPVPQVELLLEAYFADFEEIVAEIKTIKDMIEDTNQFISAHLDSVRNKMLRYMSPASAPPLAPGCPW